MCVAGSLLVYQATILLRLMNFFPTLYTMDRSQHVNCVDVISSENAGQS